MFGKKDDGEMLEYTDYGLSNVVVYAGFHAKTREVMKPVPDDVLKTWFTKIKNQYSDHLGESLEMYYDHYGVKTRVFDKIPRPDDGKKLEKFFRKNCPNYPRAAMYYNFGDMFATYLLVIEYDGTTPKKVN